MIQVTAIPIYTSNYVWTIKRADHKAIYVVDPGDAGPILKYLRENDLTLEGVIITHSHHDHITGINELISHFPAPVYGPISERIPQVTMPLKEGDTLKLWDNIEVNVLHTPGHLPEHICYHFTIGDQPYLFCADILFSSGCGRIFIGTPAELKGSIDRLMSLPDNTLVFCAHEYTLANLNFARTLEPTNADMKIREADVKTIRKKKRPSLPTTIGLERKVNPFCRCTEAELITNLNAHKTLPNSDPLTVFTALRAWKDNF